MLMAHEGFVGFDVKDYIIFELMNVMIFDVTEVFNNKLSLVEVAYRE